MATENRRKIGNWLFRMGLAAFLCLGLSSCVSVKEYQKMYLNDEDMSLADRKIDAYAKGIQAYREGAVGGNGGKSGGGCGCN